MNVKENTYSGLIQENLLIKTGLVLHRFGEMRKNIGIMIENIGYMK